MSLQDGQDLVDAWSTEERCQGHLETFLPRVPNTRHDTDMDMSLFLSLSIYLYFNNSTIFLICNRHVRCAGAALSKPTRPARQEDGA